MRQPSHCVLIRRSCFTFATVLGMAGCSSATNGGHGASPLAQDKPLIYVSSLRSTRDVSACLRERLPNARASRSGEMTELNIGRGHWVILLTPSATGGTIVRVAQPASGAQPEESEMRFHLARCLT
ncbi:hypothetical protein KQH60_05805 [Mycetohabitans sp. B8]|uniref:hypothetical protein n=1 Tax=Mycetohabitans sp. B8 TaxID=2841845 RepID=UPI001F2B3427|nr:hypothetical protein [Mycetohabitans sp. B8]MCG1042095.1 hypothetical protein [Mycetohabitans sp. B8]